MKARATTNPSKVWARLFPVLMAAWVGGLLTGCDGGKRTLQSDPDVVATVAGHQVTRKDLEMALVAKEARKIEQKGIILQQIIQEESIFQAARAAKFDEDPTVAAAVKQLIVARYRERHLASTNVLATDNELEMAYAANQAKFSVAAMVNVSLIHIHSSPKSVPEKRLEAENKAKELLGKAKAMSMEDYAQLARDHSEDASTRYQGGQTGWMPLAGSTRLDPSLHEAIAKLKEVGETAPLISVSNGFYIVRLVGLKPSAIRPLKDVADGLRYQIIRKKTEDLQQSKLAALVKGVEVRINESAVQSVQLPAVEPSHPPLGPGTPTAQISQP